MNIHQLLTASQSSPQTQSQGTFSRQDSANGFFQQALLQASDAQRFSASMLGEVGSPQTTSQPAQLGQEALSDLLADALGGDVEGLSAALEALGLDVSASDLSELLAQLQSPTSDAGLNTPTLSEGGNSPLDEIAARLALMASFAEGDTQTGTATPINPALLEAITQHLDINQTEAAQLVTALHVVVSQQQKSQPLPVDNVRLSSASTPTIEAQVAPKAQPDTLYAQGNTSVGAAPQISSEALMGALMTQEGAPKGTQAGEHLLTGFSLATGSGPLASAPSAQGFTPSVSPTPATLSTPFTSTAWPQQLGQQLVQISQRGGEQHVQMQLNPAELGPLSISLKFGEQGAQAHFLSAHAQVRQVLEQAIPQLREALAEQGVSLGETSVGEQQNPNAQAFAQSGGNRGTGARSNGGDETLGEALPLDSESSPLIMDGRVDLYA
ncbi:flagellar hook-length control protein FliK [Vreelandella neptunia]|uniref:Flagellar hook-length control protein FliK n=1 Tax=Vreelandella neptunia TaxID=115551 RepID=A0ABS9S7Y4_9GAMM|nr:flagellar hook-length control protein FliK [Halomonas neptunia]MCH4812219.1 flagellar hook-length control protein FliK [Halomonas neptunia]